MSTGEPEHTGHAVRGWRALGLVLLAAVGARALFLLLMPPTFSADMRSWFVVSQTLGRGQNPYAFTTLLNWPPLWMMIVWGIARASDALQVEFPRMVQLVLILIELGLMVCTYRLLRLLVPEAKAALLLVVGLCVNPVAVLLVCQHGNFDVLVGLWVVLLVTSLVRFQRHADTLDFLAACLFLGMAILTKTVPFVLIPLLLGAARRVVPRARALGAVLLLGPVALGMSILFVLAPEGVLRNVIGYRSFGGYFGISGVLGLLGLERAAEVYGAAFPWLLLAGLAVLSLALWRGRALAERDLVLLATLLLAAVPALGPGYGPQYVYWYLPLLVVGFACERGRWRALLGAGYLVATGTYLVEYGVFDSHGSFLLALWPEDARILRWSELSLEPGTQTLVRLPLFAAFLALLSGGAVMLWRRRRGQGPGPLPGAPGA